MYNISQFIPYNFDFKICKFKYSVKIFSKTTFITVPDLLFYEGVKLQRPLYGICLVLSLQAKTINFFLVTLNKLLNYFIEGRAPKSRPSCFKIVTVSFLVGYSEMRF